MIDRQGKNFLGEPTGRSLAMDALDVSERLRIATGGVSIHDLVRSSSVYEHARRAADLSASTWVPFELEQHRLTGAQFADQLALGSLAFNLDARQWQDPAFLSTFGTASALSRALDTAGMMDASVHAAMKSMAFAGIPDTLDLRTYRHLLNASGLTLPRWPRFRRLTEKQKQRIQRERLAGYQQPKHIAQAKSLVHQHELYLRDAISALMESEYGESWAEERLPLCGDHGKSLLGRWRKHGGGVFDHADYPHYVAVMVHPEHFTAIFSLAFEDKATIEDLVGSARRLRATSHHPHEFTPADLRDLRVTWNGILKGLRRLEPGQELDWAS
ncbi:MAG TPA: hypothetical protein VG942_13930 [Hyphomonadaceae bacterium]|nr:hypothetical protein [Hyphomonadaceae bacterium]